MLADTAASSAAIPRWRRRVRSGACPTLVVQDREGMPDWLRRTGAPAYVAVVPGAERRYRELRSVRALPSRTGSELIHGILAQARSQMTTAEAARPGEGAVAPAVAPQRTPAGATRVARSSPDREPTGARRTPVCGPSSGRSHPGPPRASAGALSTLALALVGASARIGRTAWFVLTRKRLESRRGAAETAAAIARWREESDAMRRRERRAEPRSRRDRRFPLGG